MSSTWELKEKSKGELKVALSGEEWQKACEKAFKKKNAFSFLSFSPLSGPS